MQVYGCGVKIISRTVTSKLQSICSVCGVGAEIDGKF